MPDPATVLDVACGLVFLFAALRWIDQDNRRIDEEARRRRGW